MFVGNSASDRLSTLAGLPHLTLPRSPYNPNFPYRLSGNLIDFDRKYDYARIAFFKEQGSSAPAYARSYFINRFNYINDEVCDFVGAEDFIGELWANVKFSFCQPNKFTYKESDIKYKDFDIDIAESLYKEETDIKELQAPIVNIYGTNYYVGCVIVTATKNNISGDNVYMERGIKYPLYTIILPFFLSEKGSVFIYDNLPEDVYIEFNISSTGVVPYGLSHFTELSNITEDGFHIVSTAIDFDLLGTAKYNIVHVSSTNSDRIYFSNDTGLFTFDKLNSESRYRGFIVINQYNVAPVEYPYYNAEIISRRPFERIRVTFGDTEEFFNPYFMDLENPSEVFSITKSLIPPYTYSIKFKKPVYRVSNRETPQTYDYTIVINNDSNFMLFTNGYAEWLRNNYNATITGLKVRQKADWANYGIQTVANMGKELISLDWIGAASKTIDAAAQAGTLAVNHDMQNKLLNLTIKDKKNAISQVAFGSSLQAAWRKQGYLRVTYERSIYYDLMIKNMKRYGVKTGLAIINTKAHQRYDYIETNDFTLTPINNVYFNDYQRAGITAQLNAGVRLWYTRQDFLNFDIPNPEV